MPTDCEPKEAAASSAAKSRLHPTKEAPMRLLRLAVLATLASAAGCSSNAVLALKRATFLECACYDRKR